MQVVPKLYQIIVIKVRHVGKKGGFLPPNRKIAGPPNYRREVRAAPIGVVCKNGRY
jgi:hypothetical protein